MIEGTYTRAHVLLEWNLVALTRHSSLSWESSVIIDVSIISPRSAVRLSSWRHSHRSRRNVVHRILHLVFQNYSDSVGSRNRTINITRQNEIYALSVTRELWNGSGIPSDRFKALTREILHSTKRRMLMRKVCDSKNANDARRLILIESSRKERRTSSPDTAIPDFAGDSIKFSYDIILRGCVCVCVCVR